MSFIAGKMGGNYLEGLRYAGASVDERLGTELSPAVDAEGLPSVDEAAALAIVVASGELATKAGIVTSANMSPNASPLDSEFWLKAY